MALLSPDDINILCKDTLIDHLGIVITEAGKKIIKATMPVDLRTKQPMGILHGGAIMALVETVGSVGSFNIVDRDKYDVVGIEINGNHIVSVKKGVVYAVGHLIHQGKRTHVWNVNVYDESHKPVSVCRITNMILEKNGK